ncbi:MAG: AAA family ATPase, partial [Bacilli bacterium]|nr:AAA family ATPase [Bacilli bacterium]
MIVYNATKKQFNDDVINNLISDKILMKLHEANIHAGEEAEYRSWQNSLNFMRNILDDKEINDDVSIAIEYQIP